MLPGERMRITADIAKQLAIALEATIQANRLARDHGLPRESILEARSHVVLALRDLVEDFIENEEPGEC